MASEGFKPTRSPEATRELFKEHVMATFRSDDGREIEEGDIREVIRHLCEMCAGCASGGSRILGLLAALDPPKVCGAQLKNAQATVYCKFSPVTCRLTRGHDGPHIPDVPSEAWRMPDAR